MRNLEPSLPELLCEADVAAGVQLLAPREVPLGGPRALTVRRTLPHKQRSLIGAWCFLDHYGPDPVDGPGAMDVPPHPHTGLQTVSWLFDGEIHHADSVGSDLMVRPGQVNLMTAGSGIQHFEVSTAAATSLHGVQLWAALPNASREVAPFFEHHRPETISVGAAQLQVFIGSLFGSSSAVTSFTPLLGAQLDLPPGASVVLPADPAFEYGLLVDSGSAEVRGRQIEKHHLGYVPVGQSELVIRAGDEALRAILFGGTPLGESIVMWWNFVGRSHDEIVAYREQWQTEVIDRTDRTGRFGSLDGHPFGALPAPMLPGVRLRPRD